MGSGRRSAQKQQRPGNPPEPLPVICWDWTKAIALCEGPTCARCAVWPGGQSARDNQGPGRDALGLSHLT